ncbi:MAG: cold shock domain-containing protein [Lewinellaceae bacterium]|nr:cold shock domain-containing protein [Lewinellaceae bacterium]
MSKSQQSFNKKEREKKQRKKKKEKEERREQRKIEKAEKGKLSFEDQLSYVDEDGNFTSKPPDPSKRKKIKAEDIVLGVPPRDADDANTEKTGKVHSFMPDKGFGFIIDSATKESIFVHIKDAYESIQVGDEVTFETEMGPKGIKAWKVKPVSNKS